MKAMQSVTRTHHYATIVMVGWLSSTRGLAATVPCPPSLNCSQGAFCEEGHSDFSYHPQIDGHPLHFHVDTIRDGAHCKCPDGYTGIECKHKFQTCDSNHTCYHGSRCVDGLAGVVGHTQRFCDCHDAKDDDGNQYVGKLCEHPVTNLCPQAQESFCVNGGVCNNQYPRKGNPCECLEGFQGPHCEFKTGTIPNCTLSCGEGYCQLEINRNEPIASENPEDYMRCVCPENFGGSNCEIAQAGFGLQHPADICTVGERGPGRPLSFCVNRGTCLLKVSTEEEHPGCDCPDTFTGPHCEKKVRQESELPNGGEDQSEAPSTRNTVVIVSLVLTAAFVISTIVLWRLRRPNRENSSVDPTMVNLAPVKDPVELAPDAMYRPSFHDRQPNHASDGLMRVNLAPVAHFDMEPDAVYRPSFHYPVVDIGPQRDEDGHDLHDIELL